MPAPRSHAPPVRLRTCLAAFPKLLKKARSPRAWNPSNAAHPSNTPPCPLQRRMPLTSNKRAPFRMPAPPFERWPPIRMSAPPLNSRPHHMPAPPLPTPACPPIRTRALARALHLECSSAIHFARPPRASNAHLPARPSTPAFEPHATHFTLKAHETAHLATPALYFAPPATPSPGPPSPLLLAQLKHPRTHTPRTTLSVARSVVGHPFPSRIDARGTRMPAVPPVARTLVTHANRTCTHPVATLAHAHPSRPRILLVIHARTPRAPTPVAPRKPITRICSLRTHARPSHPLSHARPSRAPAPSAPTPSACTHARRACQPNANPPQTHPLRTHTNPHALARSTPRPPAPPLTPRSPACPPVK
ncbi:hypothetical protein K438DRAFT_1983263 [Mycena galopus ATCC 62051]|nr:hypothetical protein K438DRAFT_1983263 [Mycena galopus ATCC 62051]